MDGHIVHHGTISTCQTAVTYKPVNSLLPVISDHQSHKRRHSKCAGLDLYLYVCHRRTGQTGELHSPIRLREELRFACSRDDDVKQIVPLDADKMSHAFVSDTIIMYTLIQYVRQVNLTSTRYSDCPH